ncbi:MAG: nucleotidyltransferase family protein [Desulfurococcaceae archaeon]|nr:nucleotidyltransferase family protein [Desulfurococcaceae archaeon]
MSLSDLCNVKAAVLAGGVGSRFHPYTEIIPKPMIPLGKSEKPVLELIVTWLKRQGIKDYVFLVGYKWKYIFNYFGDGSRLGVKIEYSLDEEDGYRNTGGALLKAHRKGLIKDTVVFWYGDILAPIDVRDLLKYHINKKADITLVLAENYSVPVGVARLSGDQRVTEFAEKPKINLHVTIGVGVLNTKLFDRNIEEELGKDFDFMGDFVPYCIRMGCGVYGYLHRGLWIDVGSLEKYKKINMEEIAIFEE